MAGPSTAEPQQSALDLETLVAPLSAEQFLEEHWPDTPFSTNEGRERAERLTRVPELESPEAALANARAVKVFKPDGEMAVVPDGKRALPLYKLGLTCYLGTRHVPALRRTQARLERDLGLPPGSVDCEMFCSSGQSGAWMHSDYDVNFALLLQGKKRWRMAPNEHIRNQTSMCVPSTREAPAPSQLELADRLPFPERMPDDALVYEVEAGGLVFMPRGWWHETEAAGDCLQVNFTVQKPMWLEVVARAVRGRLLSDPDWREYAFDVVGPPERRAEATKRLAALLPALRAELDELLAGDDPERLAEKLIDQAYGGSAD